jgi:hypothetical protein
VCKHREKSTKGRKENVQKGNNYLKAVRKTIPRIHIELEIVTAFTSQSREMLTNNEDTQQYTSSDMP